MAMTIAELPTSTQIEERQLHRFSYNDYCLIAELDGFRGRRFELIDGVIFDMAPQKDLHTAGTLLVIAALQQSCPGFIVRPQMPLRVANNTELEPDVALVTGSIRDYIGKGQPRTAALAVEVSDTSLTFDRNVKAEFYAAAGITDYWIVNVQEKCVEVYRSPLADSAATHGFRYTSITTLKPPESLSPLANPAAQIPIADLLP
jgi:Uma2 family endonuclease